MKIDLGAENKIEVIFSGKSHLLRSPTARDVISFQKKMSSMDSTEQTGLFIDFINSLGLPQDVCDVLDVTQLQKLSEGIVGSVSEKK